jgi:hypothetical protein
VLVVLGDTCIFDIKPFHSKQLKINEPYIRPKESATSKKPFKLYSIAKFKHRSFTLPTLTKNNAPPTFNVIKHY